MPIGKRELRIAAILILIIALLSMFQEQLCIKMEGATILALCVAALLFVVPNLSSIAKVKVGEVELEFKQELDKLEKLVNQEEVSKSDATPKASMSGDTTWQYYYEEYNAILISSSSNLEKILRASQLVERMIINVGEDFKLKSTSKSPFDVIKELSKEGLITDQEISIYKEFMCNSHYLI